MACGWCPQRIYSYYLPIGRQKMRKIGIIFLVVLVSGCAAVMEATVLDKASFELDCPAQEISVVNLGHRSYGAEGCDKRITYVIEGDCSAQSACRAVKEASEAPE